MKLTALVLLAASLALGAYGAWSYQVEKEHGGLMSGVIPMLILWAAGAVALFGAVVLWLSRYAGTDSPVLAVAKQAGLVAVVIIGFVLVVLLVVSVRV